MNTIQINPITSTHFSAASSLSPATIIVPGSKSFTNRALLAAALAQGKSTLHHVLISDDTKVMIEALKALGVKIVEKGDVLEVYGCKGVFKKPSKELYFENAGTAIRFMTGILALQKFESIVTGNARMKNRPIKDLVDALRQGGANIEYLGTEGYPPLLIKGGYKGGKVTIKGKESSQYVSSLLLASPYTAKPTDITIEDALASKPYIDMTLQTMKAFGVSKGSRSGYKRFIIANKTMYKSTDYHVEADASSASYFFALAALHHTAIRVANATYPSMQGDIKFIDLLAKAGCKVKVEKGKGVLVECPEKLKLIGAIDMNTMPDVALTMAVIAAFTEGKTRLLNIPNLRVKECDRILAMTNELNKINCKARQMAAGIEIKGHPHKYHGAEIETYDDHRIAMCFALIGTVVPGIIIKDPECVSKTYPHFWDDLKAIGVKFSTHG